MAHYSTVGTCIKSLKHSLLLQSAVYHFFRIAHRVELFFRWEAFPALEKDHAEIRWVFAPLMPEPFTHYLMRVAEPGNRRGHVEHGRLVDGAQFLGHAYSPLGQDPFHHGGDPLFDQAVEIYRPILGHIHRPGTR